MTDWVQCPICGENDMRSEPDGKRAIISCVNLICGSNGGDNFSGLSSDKLLAIANAVLDVKAEKPPRGDPALEVLAMSLYHEVQASIGKVPWPWGNVRNTEREQYRETAVKLLEEQHASR